MAAQLNSARINGQSSGSTPLLTAWIARWPDARREFEMMLEAYAQRYPTYNPGSVEPILEMMDTTLYSIAHRAEWLQSQLARAEGASTSVDDDEFYAMLAEAQVD